jgi:acyl-CoA synthetase (AMP-forming)/AMP-acid ligase II
MRRLRSVFPHAEIFLMYGLTECQRVSYLPPGLIDQCPDSVGVPIPGTSVHLVDEDGRPVGPGIVGELVVRGPHVMKGYWNDAEATARVLRPDAQSGEMLLHTGDLFRTGPNRLLYFVERRDDVIKVRGEKVAPRQIEEVIARFPGVAEVSVYGVPDDVAGEAIATVVKPCDGVTLTADDIRRHCHAHLEPFMVPTVVDVRATLPTTTSGKVSRRALRLLTLPRGESAA